MEKAIFKIKDQLGTFKACKFSVRLVVWMAICAGLGGHSLPASGESKTKVEKAQSKHQDRQMSEEARKNLNAWLQVHQFFSQVVQKNMNAKYAFLGDSITFLMDKLYVPSMSKEKYGKEAFDAFISKNSYVNVGISGDRVEQLLFRVTNGNFPEGFTPDHVSVMIGTNNVPFANSPAFQISSLTMQILDHVHKVSPKSHIWLLDILPRGGQNKRDEMFRRKIIEINELNRKAVADKPYVTPVSLYEHFLDSKGIVRPDFFAVEEHFNLHPNLNGYKEIFARLESAISEREKEIKEKKEKKADKTKNTK